MSTTTDDHLPDAGLNLDAELIDAVTDVLMRAPSSAARAEVLRALVAEVHASVAWLHDTDHPTELASLQRVLNAAREHRENMANGLHVTSQETFL